MSDDEFLGKETATVDKSESRVSHQLVSDPNNLDQMAWLGNSPSQAINFPNGHTTFNVACDEFDLY